MKRTAYLLLAFISGTALAADLPVYSFLEAGDHIGEKAVVTGKVVDTYNSGKACFINFHTDWRNHFSVVIFAKNFDRFETTPEILYKGADVRVTGEIKEYEGRSEIVVEDPSQIEIVSGGGGKASEIPWKDAGAYVGKLVTVEGEIVRTHNTGKLAFLNFDQDIEKTLTVVMFERIFERFPESPEKYFLKQVVRVTGNVKEREGKPEIIVTDPKQIEILRDEEDVKLSPSSPTEAMLRALIDLLIEKGVFTQEEFDKAFEDDSP